MEFEELCRSSSDGVRPAQTIHSVLLGDSFCVELEKWRSVRLRGVTPCHSSWNRVRPAQMPRSVSELEEQKPAHLIDYDLFYSRVRPTDTCPAQMNRSVGVRGTQLGHQNDDSVCIRSSRNGDLPSSDDSFCTGVRETKTCPAQNLMTPSVPDFEKRRSVQLR